MKKLLLATTMLITAGSYAAADVAVSGDARMGVTSYDGDAQFSNRVRIKFSGSGTTDGGLAFGASIRADNAGDNGDENNNGADGTDGSVFISGAFGKITMGGVDSGDAAAVGQLSSVGYEGLGSGNSIAYAADGGTIGFGDNDINGGDASKARVLYTYTAGAVTVNASVGQIDNTEESDDEVVAGVYVGATTYGVGVSYNWDAVTVAVGYGSVTADVAYEDRSVSLTDTSASVTYVAGDTTLKAIYQDKSGEDGDDELEQKSMGASVDHKLGAVTLTAYALSSEFSANYTDDTASLNRYGLGVAYDLGGGAVIKAGMAQLDTISDDVSGTETESYNAFDVGVNFSF
jgi:outer membrane protein OmpU